MSGTAAALIGTPSWQASSRITNIISNLQRYRNARNGGLIMHSLEISRPRRLSALLELHPFFRCVQHLAGAGAVVGADDAVFRHEVDQPRRAAIADAERPLQKRHAAAAFAHDNLNRLFE